MNKTIMIFAFSLISTVLSAQKLDSTALILIDIQEFYFPGGKMVLVNPEAAAQNAALVLKYFREKGGLVVHVRHNSEPGGAIHKLVAPLASEKVFSKVEVNSFLNTGLNDYLVKKGIKNLVLCGMQTHMCLEAATRAGHDLGYKVTVIADACATRDLTYGGVTVKANDVHYSTLATLKSYATVVNTAEFLQRK
jgi:nicotinamidase-related amidase